MSRRHIAIIDPAVVTPELGAFNRMVRASPLPLTFHLPALFGTASLRGEETKGLAGIIVLGSRASVHQNLVWQQELESWLHARWQESVPTFGICYGHQLIAHILGGKVGFAFPDNAKRVGFRKVEFQPNRLQETPTHGRLYYSHEEVVLIAPKEMRVLATSSEVAIEGLEHHTKPIWSLQTHPETVSVNGNVPTQPGDLDFGHSLVESFFKFAIRPK